MTSGSRMATARPSCTVSRPPVIFLMTLDGEEGGGRFKRAHCVAIDPRGSEPRLLVTDRSNHRVGVYDLDGRFIKVLGAGELRMPSAFAVAGDLLFIAELWSRMAVYDPDDRLVGYLGGGEEAWEEEAGRTGARVTASSSVGSCGPAASTLRTASTPGRMARCTSPSGRSVAASWSWPGGSHRWSHGTRAASLRAVRGLVMVVALGNGWRRATGKSSIPLRPLRCHARD